MKFCQALNGSLNIERDRIHYCYVVKQHMPSIPWNPDEDLPIENIQIVRKALIRGLNENMDQVVPEYEKFGEHSGGTHPCKGCRQIIDIDDNTKIPTTNLLTDYLHMQAFTYCNAKCVYCNLSQDAGRTPLNRGHDLDQAVYKAVNHLIDLNMISLSCRVIFSSGEPTLSKLGMQTLLRLVEKKHNILVNTNAIHFSPELEKAMLTGNTSVQVSLDAGDRKSFYEIKGVDKFDAVTKNIDRYNAASSENSKFLLKYIVFSKTTSRDTLDKFVSFCSQHQIRNVVVNVNYNEGEAVSANNYDKTTANPENEVADISTLSAFGYLAARLELCGFRVHKELAHLTTNEQQLAKYEYKKALQIELSTTNLTERKNQLKNLTIFSLAPDEDIFKDLLLGKTKPASNDVTATLHIAASLKNLGLAVNIINSMEELNEYSCDVFVSSREWDVFKKGNTPGKLNYLWCHDDINTSMSNPLQDTTTAEMIYNKCDGIIFMSHYQQLRWLNTLNTPLNKAFLSSSGVDLSKFDLSYNSLINRPPWAYYTSDSFQGLVILLKGWHLIKAAVPDARLQLYKTTLIDNDAERESFAQLYRLAGKLDGITCYDYTNQSQLENTAQNCRVLASPSIVPKINCARELEAMAAGSVVVSMALGALPETAWHNPLVPMVDGWFNQWVSEVVRLLVDDQYYLHIARHNLDSVTYYNWNNVATRWLERFNLDLIKTQGK